jgi:hypothetical protein
MVIVLIVAAISAAVLGIWLKRRHNQRKVLRHRGSTLAASDAAKVLRNPHPQVPGASSASMTQLHGGGFAATGPHASSSTLPRFRSSGSLATAAGGGGRMDSRGTAMTEDSLTPMIGPSSSSAAAARREYSNSSRVSSRSGTPLSPLGPGGAASPPPMPPPHGHGHGQYYNEPSSPTSAVSPVSGRSIVGSPPPPFRTPSPEVAHRPTSRLQKRQSNRSQGPSTQF